MDILPQSVVVLRVCKTCNETLPVEMFTKQASYAGGRLPSCKSCMREYRRNQSRRLYWKDPIAARLKDPRKRNRKTEQIDNYVPVTDPIKLYRTRRSQYRRKLREAGIPLPPMSEHHTLEEWISLCEKFKGRCVKCGRKAKLSVDHIVPSKQGGTDQIWNIQPLCGGCNASKSDEHVNYRYDRLLE